MRRLKARLIYNCINDENKSSRNIINKPASSINSDIDMADINSASKIYGKRYIRVTRSRIVADVCGNMYVGILNGYINRR